MGLLRLVLAFVVALDHYRIHIIPDADHLTQTYLLYLKAGLNAGHAVILFYVISGFLISYALENKYLERQGGMIRYFESRFIRIYPFYWFVFAAVAFVIPTGAYQAPVADRVWALSLLGHDFRFLAGGPQMFPPWLGQAWTLATEVTFYLLAPLLFRSVRVFLLAFVVALLARILLVHEFGFDQVWTYQFTGSTLVFFLLGHLGRICFTMFTRQLGAVNLVFGMIFVAFLWLNVGRSFDNIFFSVCLAGFALFLPYLFEKTKDSPTLNFLGDNTYTVYLSHTAIIYLLYFSSYSPLSAYSPSLKGLAFVSMPGPAGHMINAVLFLLACMLISIVLHLLVERPLAAFTRLVAARARNWHAANERATSAL